MKEYLTKIFSRFEEADPEPNRPPEKARQGSEFKSLVSVMLSAQTQDVRTAKASKQLFSVVQTPYDIVKLKEEEIVELIRPVGMYNRKAKLLLQLAQYIIENYEGKVPKSREELQRIPGVGRKSIDIMMRFVYGEPAIAVDTHVRRICYRLGLSEKNDADTIAVVLEEHTPDQYKWGAHEWLIQYGKWVCTSRKPKCSSCMLSDICPKVDVIQQ